MFIVVATINGGGPSGSLDSPPSAATLTRLHELGSAEDVFAYSRISPDGRHLAYTSQHVLTSGQTERIVKVVDLRNGRAWFAEPGLDPYWSPDGSKLVFMSRAGVRTAVAVLDARTRDVFRNVAPASLGDYPSWGRTANGADTILTIDGHYYALDDLHRAGPHRTVPPCAAVGQAERPLISKDAKRLSTFSFGVLVIRNLVDCDNILITGLRGAKADFSFNGRYIAYHAPRRDGNGFQIEIADLRRRRFTVIATESNRNYFPSWTADGKVLFRQDGQEYRGFVLASRVLSGEWHPFPAVSEISKAGSMWEEIFPGTARPRQHVNVVAIWSPWVAHSPDAPRALQAASERPVGGRADVAFIAAAEPSSPPEDVSRMLEREQITVPQAALSSGALALTHAHNQIPSNLLFIGGRLRDVRLGAQSTDALMEWVGLSREVPSPPE